MIAVVSTANDSHFRCVAEELRRMGQQACILELPRLGRDACMAMYAGRDRSKRWSAPGRDAIDLEGVECVWYRRNYPSTFSPPFANRGEEEWATREWRDAMTGFFMSSGARFVSNPWSQNLASAKAYQLHVAQEVGLSIPDTVMTNDADVARAFVRKHAGQIVHKCVTTPRDRWIPTRKWHPRDEEELSWLYLAPTFFQEEVVAPYELRITVVGRDIYAARFPVAAGVTDARPDLDVPYTSHDLPDEVSSRLLAFMDRLNLQIGTIDMRQTESGEYVFLEINPQGQFLYVEIKTGMPITQAVARLLARGRD